jgi:hypothetical protein
VGTSEHKGPGRNLPPDRRRDHRLRR